MNFALLEEIWKEPLNKNILEEDSDVEIITPSKKEKNNVIENFNDTKTFNDKNNNNNNNNDIEHNFKERIDGVDYNIIVNKIMSQIESKLNTSNSMFNSSDITIILVFGLIIILLIHGLISLGKMLGSSENKNLNKKIDYILKHQSFRGGGHYRYCKY